MSRRRLAAAEGSACTPRRAARPRGFVLLVVLVLVAALSVVVAARLEVLRSEAGATTRREEEVAARASAEACMEKAYALVQAYASHTSATQPLPPVDFDGLLDPYPTTTGDEHVPGAPWVATTIGGRRFGLLRQDASATLPRLQCLLRFEDNADDAAPIDAAHPATATSNTAGVLEGPDNGGVDVPTRDRDRSIQVVAVGLAPFFPSSVPNDEVYEKAHARVTLQRWFQSRGAPAVFAGGSARFDENVSICGNGGVQADAVAFEDGSCACGAVVGAGASTAEDCHEDDSDDECDGEGVGCENLDAMSAGAQPNPPAAPTTTFSLAAPASWIDAPATKMGDPGACRFHLTKRTASQPAVAWIWDRTSSACAAATPNPIPAPCPYDSTHFPSLSSLTDVLAPRADPTACPAPRSCWKPIFVDDGYGHAWEQTNATGPVANEKVRFSDARIAYQQTSMAATDRPLEDLSTLPALTWEALCTGATAGRSLTPDDAFWWTTNQRWRVSDVERDALPWPAVFGVEGELRVDGNVGTTTPVVWRAMATEKITVDSNVRMCCPTCRCDSVPTSVAQCTGTDATVRSFLGTTQVGVVLAGEALCRMDNNVSMYGRMHCGSVDANNNTCALGGVTTSSTLPPGASCDAGGGTICNTGIGVCLKNNAFLVGDALANGSICMNNNATVAGNVWSNDDVLFESNAEIVGQIVAGGDVSLDENSQVTFSGQGGIGGGARSMAWAEARY